MKTTDNLSKIASGITVGLLILVSVWGTIPDSAQAALPPSRCSQNSILCVTMNGMGCDANICNACYSSIQAAVEVTNPGDQVRVAAGLYREMVETKSYVVRVQQSIFLLGGYVTDNWLVPDPAANPTILDAMEEGRVLWVQDTQPTDRPTGSITVTVSGFHLTRGSALGLGGGDGVDAGGGLYVLSSTLTLNDCWVYDNEAGNELAGIGGGVYAAGSTLSLSNLHVYSNTAAVGGGLFAVASDLDVYSSTFEANEALAGDGGGIGLARSPATIAHSAVSANAAAFHGGGIAALEGTLGLLDSRVYSNTAGVNGGGVYAWHSSDFSLAGSVVTGNQAGQLGGGLSVDAAPVNVSSSVVDSNHAALGGGLYLSQSTGSIDHNRIANNQAQAEGGGFYVYGSDSVVEDNEVVSNTAVLWGGGLVVDAGTAILRRNGVSGNSAQQDGGGIVLWESAATLRRNRVTGNVAGQSGGGLYAYRSELWTQNGVVADNQAAVAGCGVVLIDSPARLLHDTIAHNGAGSAIGLYADGGTTAWLTNTIVVSQAVGVYATANASVAVDGVLWWGNGADSGGLGSVVVTREVSGPPCFEVGGYHITRLSAARDRAVESGLSTDLDGDPRPVGPRPDLGADEYPWGASLEPDVVVEVFPGQVVTHLHQLTNLSAYSDTYSLTLQADWPGGIYGPITRTLLPGIGAPVVVTVSVPAGALSGTVMAAAVTAASWNEPGLSATARETHTVGMTGTATLGPDRESLAYPGETVVYAFTLTNGANISQAFTLTAGSDFTVTIVPSVVSLPPFSQAAVTATLQVPGGALSGTVDAGVVTALGEIGGLVSARMTTTVGLTGTVALGPDRAATVGPGSVVVYTHTLSNEANVTQAVGLEVSTPAEGFSMTLSPPEAILPPFAQTTISLTVHVARHPDPLGRAVLLAVGSVTGTATAIDTTTVRWAVYLPLLQRDYPLYELVGDAPDVCPGYPISVRVRQYGEDFDHANDNDWYAFGAEAGRIYAVDTFDLGPLADTVLFLYDVDCATLLASNDDCSPGDPRSCLTWQAPADGTYHLLVRHYDWAQYGAGTEYTLYVR
ncbi:MAG: right-handed parallel beta-helix repeat-containing protein [Anaerolineae bacterium]|nr:right-handed parallel beta-helix repeat-containing protein [Anaerolineae bacterium]